MINLFMLQLRRRRYSTNMCAASIRWIRRVRWFILLERKMMRLTTWRIIRQQIGAHRTVQSMTLCSCTRRARLLGSRCQDHVVTSSLTSPQLWQDCSLVASPAVTETDELAASDSHSAQELSMQGSPVCW